MFASQRDGNNAKIVIMNENDSNEILLTDGVCYDGKPDLSPDGAKIIYIQILCSGGGTGQIWSMNTYGSGKVNLTDNNAENRGPRWLPDGTQIAYDADNTIWLMNFDGSGKSQIISQHGRTPSWSKDGNKIVFWSNRDGASNQEIYVMDVDGSNQVNISNFGGNDATPQWSPVDDKIVFRSSRFGGTEIMIMDTDGSNQSRLTTSSNASDPTWSPDGTKIVYADDPAGLNIYIYVMNADGTNQTRLTTESELNFTPDWGP